MKRLVVITVVLVASARAAGVCDWLLAEKWNAFAADANRYVLQLREGLKDVRLQKQVTQKWNALTKCECW